MVLGADLFCGAGGTSTGLVRACERYGRKLDLIAVNHWEVAIETHSLNHPWARHLCARIDHLDPAKVVPSGRLHLLVASPECTHFSLARGGRPMNDQLRASPWLILKWLQELYVENVLIENVRELLNWGPLGANGRPLKSRRGETFHAFIQAVKSLGYTVDWRVLNCADYGDPTTRERLFIIARRGRRKIKWPEPSHAPIERLQNGDLFTRLKPWRPAREIIDWSIKGDSIFRRKRPLAPATRERIAAGMKKFGWPAPFLLVLRNHMDGRSVDEPVPTLAAGGQHIGLVEPFLVKYFGSGENIEPVTEPLSTVTTKDRFGLVEPGTIDILFRMLQPHELAAAMSFPKEYRFAGNREAIVRQIGNAVPVETATALCEALLE